jgi:hypothetical protein
MWQEERVDTMKGTKKDIAREGDTISGNWMGRNRKDSGTGRERKWGWDRDCEVIRQASETEVRDKRYGMEL